MLAFMLGYDQTIGESLTISESESDFMRYLFHDFNLIISDVI